MTEIPDRVNHHEVTPRSNDQYAVVVGEAYLRQIDIEVEDVVKVISWGDRIEIRPVEDVR